VNGSLGPMWGAKGRHQLACGSVADRFPLAVKKVWNGYRVM